MPDIASLHPLVIHFVVALLIIGVLARVVSVLPLGPRLAFTGPMAAVLILIGTAASVVAVQSGLEAHERAESMPGVRAQVEEHEEWGERTRNIFLVVSVLEIGALAFASKKAGLTRGLKVGSAIVGVVGLAALFVAADAGGDLVYSYAGGVGVRTGDTTDVRRLLVAGLFQNAQLDRTQGRSDDAARLTDQLGEMIPGDTGVRLLRIQSFIQDRKDPKQAMAMLDSIAVPAGNRRLTFQKAMLTSQAFEAMGMRDSARITLENLEKVMGKNPRLDAMIEHLR